MCGTFDCSELMKADLADAAGMGVAAGKGASAGAMREPTASNAAPTKQTTRFTALDLPPGRHLRPIGAIS
jgi:hypothetical protein